MDILKPQDILETALRILTAELSARGQMCVNAHREFHHTPYTQQAGIDLAFPDQELVLPIECFAQRYLLCSMANLANLLHYPGKVVLFGYLELPFGMEWSEARHSDRIGMRFIRGYNLETNMKFARFDVLFRVVDETDLTTEQRNILLGDDYVPQYAVQPATA